MPRGVYKRKPRTNAKVQLACPNSTDPRCKKIFYRWPSQIVSTISYCSLYCRIKSYKHNEQIKQGISVRMTNKVGREAHSYKHGLTAHQSYSRWGHMIDRCYNEDNPEYEFYGGRGIAVCEEWRSSPEGLRRFLEYLDENLGPCPEGYSLDRIDNDGNYEPGNIRWASKLEQIQNSKWNRSGQSNKRRSK